MKIRTKMLGLFLAGMLCPVAQAQTGLPASVAAPAASHRYAVVVGNGAYVATEPLRNAEADARAVALMLRSQGFTVEERYNLDKRGFEDLMSTILFETGPDSEVVFYYAGHGIQIGRQNYILPIDAQLSTPYDTPFETVTLDSVLQVIGARSRMQLVILDSCRDNPFEDSAMMTELDRSLYETKSGFQPMTAPINSLLSFSTSPGRVALDGEGDNSPFTEALVDVAVTNPDTRIRDILDTVRRRVHDATDGQQVPWESSTLIEPFFFRTPDGARNPPVVAEAPIDRRGFQTVTVDTVRSGDASDGVVLETELDRRIALGEALGRGIALAPGDEIAIESRLTHGRLRVERSGLMTDYAGGTLTASELDTLVYVLDPVSRAGTLPVNDLVLLEQINIVPAAQQDSAGTPVDIRMTPAPCDREAGNWLDPEGVGLGRFPNEINPDRAIPACEAAIAEYPDMGRFHYQLGRAYLANREYQRALDATTRARDLGHTRAWTGLGTLIDTMQAIERGISNEKAPMEALQMFAKGAEMGDPYAYYALGRQLLRFAPGEEAKREGFALLEQSITFGHTFAMNELGYYFLDEDSEHYEPDRAMRYLTESAARDDVYGYHNLGIVYDRGLGGREKDAEIALEWYTKAYDGLHPSAPVDIGRLYYLGRLGDGPDREEAIRWYDRGLERGSAWGGANGAWIIANETPQGFDRSDAAVRAAKTAVLRNPSASKQAKSVLAGLTPREIDEATQKIAKAFIPDLTVDGIIGPASRRAIGALAAEFDFALPADDAMERLLTVARVHWRKNGIRIDLL